MNGSQKYLIEKGLHDNVVSQSYAGGQNLREPVYVSDILENRTAELRKKLEKCYSDVTEAIQSIGDNRKVFYILNEIIKSR